MIELVHLQLVTKKLACNIEQASQQQTGQNLGKDGNLTTRKL